jgi:hypothetical protein
MYRNEGDKSQHIRQQSTYMFSHSLLIEYLSLFQFKHTSGNKSVSWKLKLAGEHLKDATK